MVKLLHMKSLYRISSSAFSTAMKLLTKALLECNTLSKSYDEGKSLVKEIGLGYQSLHACSNNCLLLRKEYDIHNSSPICGLSRWKDPNSKKKYQKIFAAFFVGI